MEKNKNGGMEVIDAKRLKAIEKENTELKRIVADLTLDNRMLKDVVSKKWQALPVCDLFRNTFKLLLISVKDVHVGTSI